MTDTDMTALLESLSTPQLSALAAHLEREKERRLRACGADGSLTEDEHVLFERGSLMSCVRSIRDRTGLGICAAKDYMDRARQRR